ncbi:MAG: uridine diphosphate-N-acetylglucosamine-binding protein YvcK [Planctomycetes bacterium]|nr:uridine diphosphate-N-acetylglucosamine-binding protein YvcK [Planctomycetota bacterium]
MTRNLSRDARRIVAIGGGTGMHSLLSGLHHAGDELVAIITVADDGGSSGRLRKDFEIPPPGDIRNCLVALSDADPILGDMFQYRFEDSMLQGHAFGNLFIAVLAKLTGDFRGAIERARALLGVRDRVIPSTDQMVVLVAEHPDGSRSTGEQAISRSGKPVQRIRLEPIPPMVSREIKDVIADAELIVLGPGSLYTSIAPNLLVPGMMDAIKKSKAPVIMVANLMTQPGETDGFSLEDHLDAITSLPGHLVPAVILAPEDSIDPERVERYAETGAVPVASLDQTHAPNGTRIVRARLIEPARHVRHDPRLLARAVHDVMDPLESEEAPRP